MKKTVAVLPVCLAALTVLLTLASCGMAGPDTRTQTPGTQQRVEADETDAAVITFDGDSVNVTGQGASAQGTDVHIVRGGTYAVRGETADGRIVVDAEDADVTVILDGAQIACADSGALHVARARKATVYVREGTANTLSDGRNYAHDDALLSQADEGSDACLLSEAELILAGGGSLTVNSSAKGVEARTDVTIDGGSYTFNCADDAVHADGNVTVRSGDLTLTSGDDAIHAGDRVGILGGNLQITAHEGVEGTRITISGGKLLIRASDDGINAAHKTKGVTPTVKINGGEIDIEMGQGDSDGIDSNGDIIIDGGTVRITGQSAFDYDGRGELNGGEVYVNGEKIATLSGRFGVGTDR